MNLIQSVPIAITVAFLSACAPSAVRSSDQPLKVTSHMLLKIEGQGQAKIDITLSHLKPYSTSQSSNDFDLPTVIDLGDFLKDDGKMNLRVSIQMKTAGYAKGILYKDDTYCAEGTYQGKYASGYITCDIEGLIKR